MSSHIPSTRPEPDQVIVDIVDLMTARLDVQMRNKDMGIELKSGDELEIKGSKVKQGEIDVILGREVIKGNDTIILRDDKGAPVWSWRKT